MNANKLTLAAVLLLVVFVASACSSDSPELLRCARTITEPGLTVLREDIQLQAGQNAAVCIFASDVTLDLNGHTLTGLGAQDYETFGVVSSGMSNITVKGGTVNDFGYGVALLSGTYDAAHTRGLAVERVRVNRPTYLGITVESFRSRVIDSEVRDVGGRSFQSLHYVYGIALRGRQCLAERNLIAEVTPDRASAEAVALSFTWNNEGCVAHANVIQQTVTGTDKNTFGVWVTVDGHVEIRGNTISGMHYSGVVPPWTVLTGNNFDRPMIHAITDRP